MGVFGGGALEVDPGADGVRGGDPVVAPYAQAPLAVGQAVLGQRAEERAGVGGPVAGGQDDGVAVEGVGVAADQGRSTARTPWGCSSTAVRAVVFRIRSRSVPATFSW